MEVEKLELGKLVFLKDAFCTQGSGVRHPHGRHNGPEIIWDDTREGAVASLPVQSAVIQHTARESVGELQSG